MKFLKNILFVILLTVFSLASSCQSLDFSKLISLDKYNAVQLLKNESVPSIVEYNKYGWDYYNVELFSYDAFINKIVIQISKDREFIYLKLIKNNQFEYGSKIYNINYREILITNYIKDEVYYVVYTEIK